MPAAISLPRPVHPPPPLSIHNASPCSQATLLSLLRAYRTVCKHIEELVQLSLTATWCSMCIPDQDQSKSQNKNPVLLTRTLVISQL
jgi:hypothetical protein